MRRGGFNLSPIWIITALYWLAVRGGECQRGQSHKRRASSPARTSVNTHKRARARSRTLAINRLEFILWLFFLIYWLDKRGFSTTSTPLRHIHPESALPVFRKERERLRYCECMGIICRTGALCLNHPNTSLIKFKLDRLTCWLRSNPPTWLPERVLGTIKALIFNPGAYTPLNIQ